MSNVTQILEDTKERLKAEMPEMEFFFLLLPVQREQMHMLSTEGIEQVQKRLVKHLQAEMLQAIVDQRRPE